MNWTAIKVGIKNLMLHKLRSLLTVLGVILGAGSVIAMLAIGEGSKREALEQIRQLGANNVIVRSVKPGQDGDEEADSTTQQQQSMVLEYGLKYQDLDRLKATIPTIRDAVPISLVKKPAAFEERWIPNARILGTTPDYQRVKSLRLRRGRFVTASDNWNTANVAVLGAGAAQRLFQFRDPIGEPVLLGDDVYQVIGVLANLSSGNSTFKLLPAQIGFEHVSILVIAASTRPM
jgi:putative ABC transport system permease protein